MHPIRSQGLYLRLPIRQNLKDPGLMLVLYIRNSIVTLH